MFFPKFPRNIMTLFSIMIFDVASARTAFPILALVFFDINSRLFLPGTNDSARSYWYALCIGLPHITSFISSPILCSISDRVGRKPLLALALFGTTLAGLVISFAVLYGNVYLLMTGMLISGVFARANPLAQAVVGDSDIGHQKISAMGWLQCFIAVGAFIGPIVGGHIAKWHFAQLNFSAAFFLGTLFGFLGLLLTVFLFKESLTHKSTRTSFGLIIKSFGLFRNKQIATLSLILFCSQITWSMYYQYISPMLKVNLNFSASAIGLFVGLIALWLVFASSYGLSFLKRFCSLHQCVMTGLYLELVGSVIAIIGFYFHVAPIVWLSALPVAAGDVIAFSAITTLYSNSASKQQQGQVMGLCYLVGMIVWTITGLFGGYLMAMNPQLPLWIAPLGVIAGLVFIKAKKTAAR
jgi:MFS family permease